MWSLTERSVNIENAEKEALDLVHEIRPGWSKEDIKTIKFTDGITNLLYGFHNGNKANMILMRIYGKGTELFINRYGEVASMLLLYKNGCAPKLYARFQNGLAYGFIPGMVLDVDTVREENYAKLIAQEMARFHKIPLEVDSSLQSVFSYSEKPCIFTKMRDFVRCGPDSFEDKEINQRFMESFPRKADFLKEIDFLEPHLDCLGSPAVFCHNDLLVGNLVYRKDEVSERVYFIDYEYGDRNYEAYDIGNHFCEFAGCTDVDYSRYPDRKFQLWWITCYLEAKNGSAPTEREVETLYVQVNKFALAAHYLWGLWALIQAKFSTIDFDFLKYGQIRFDEYNKRKEEFLSMQLPQ